MRIKTYNKKHGLVSKNIILKGNVLKALCFTQINNATDAVVRFVHQIINHKQLNEVIQLSLGALSNKTDASSLSEGQSSLHIHIKTKQIIQLIWKHSS